MKALERYNVKRAAASLLGVGLLVAGILVGPAPEASATTTTTVSQCVSSRYTVPAGVTKVVIDVIGGAGKSGAGNDNGGIGGAGGDGSEVRGTVSVTPGQTLYLGVAATNGAPGGAHGGTFADLNHGWGGAGGNASWISSTDPGGSCSLNQANLLAVGAGGGGGGGAGTLLNVAGNGIGGAGGVEGFNGGNGGYGIGSGSHDGHPGTGPTELPSGIVNNGVGGGGGSGSEGLYPFDTTCYPGYAGAGGNALAAGAGGLAGYPLNGNLNAGCKGYIGNRSSGGGGGGGGGYYGGGGGGGADDADGSGGGGGAGLSMVAGTSTTGTSSAQPPSVAVNPADTAPIFTGAQGATFTIGTFSQVTVSTLGYPAPAFAPVNGLPPGLSFADNGDGTGQIYGTPSGASSLTTVPLTIWSSVSVATENYTIQVDGPPSIISASSAIFQAGTFGNFNVAALGQPVPTLSVSSLPAWLTFTDAHNGTGGLYGTPPTTGFNGQIPLTFTAANGLGTNATQAFTLNVFNSVAVSATAAPMFTTQTHQFSATGTRPDGTTADLTSALRWSSTTPAVATVSAGGLVSAVTAGSTTITAQGAFVSGSITITVKNPTSIAVTPANVTINPGATQQYTATATYADNSTADLTGVVTWSATGSAATITPGGLASAVSAGQYDFISAIIHTSNTTYVLGQTQLNVGLGTVTSLAVTPPNPTISMSQFSPTLQMTAEAQFSSGYQVDESNTATWTSSNTGVATIDANGLVTAKSPGNSTIQAVYGGVTSSVSLKVTLGDPVSIAVTPVSPTLSPGAVQQFTATATYGDSSTGNISSVVTWSTNQPAALVSISNTGLATVHSAVPGGSFNVYAYYQSTTASLQAPPDTVTVSLGHPTSIAISPSPIVMGPGDQVFATAVGTYLNGVTVDITRLATWSSSNTSLINASSGGSINANNFGSGSVTITVTSSDGTVTGTATATLARVQATGPTADDVPLNALFTSGTFTASSGSGTYIWSAQGLPSGFSLTNTTGPTTAITGTMPLNSFAVGLRDTVTVTAKNAAGNPAPGSATYVITFTKAVSTTIFTAPATGENGAVVTMNASTFANTTTGVQFSVDPSSGAGVCTVGSTNYTGGTAPATFTVPVTLNQVGSCVVDANNPSDFQFLAAPTVSQTITVTPSAVTITANSKSMTYGTTPPTFDVNSSGFVGVDTLASLSGTLSCATSPAASASLPAGTYPVTCSGLTSVKYQITFNSGTLTVAPATLTVSAPSLTVARNDAFPALTPTYTGLGLNDTVASLTAPASCTTLATTTATAGVFFVSCSGAADPNYTIIYHHGLLTITATLVNGVVTGSQNYGDAAPSLTVIPIGWPTGLTASGTISCTAVVGGSAIGNHITGGAYTIDGSTCTVGLSDPNYAVRVTGGSFTVYSIAPTVTFPAPGAITYGTALGSLQLAATATAPDGSALPGTFTYEVAGYGAAPAAGIILPAGPGYHLYVFFTASDTNDYTANTFAQTTIDVNQAPLTVTPQSLTTVFNQRVGTFPYTITGLLNGDTAASLVNQPFCAASYFLPASYTISCSPLTEPNYVVDTSATATLTVTKANTTTAAAVLGGVGGPGTSTVLRATVGVVAPGGGGPSGSVVFTDNGSPITCAGGTPTLNGPTAQCTVTFATAGVHQIVATYNGDTKFFGSSAVTLSIDVGAPGMTVFGTVSDTLLRPIANVKVEVFNSYYGIDLGDATTDANGHYAITLTTASSVKVKFFDPSSTWATAFNGGATNAASAAAIAVAAGSQVNVDAALVPFVGTIHGTVTDPGAAPLAGINITVTNVRFGVVVARATTDSVGHYAIAGLAPYADSVTFTDPALAHAPASISVTPISGGDTALNETLAPGSVPGAPTGVVAVAANAAATVRWSTPASDGGQPINGYTVTAYPGGATCRATSLPLSCTIAGLTNATPYTFAVTATNAIGTGIASVVSNTVTPWGIASLSTQTGPTTGGQILVRGNGFTGTTSVKFGNVATAFFVASDSYILALVPPHAAGFDSVSVTTPSGTTAPALSTFYIYSKAVPGSITATVTAALGGAPVGGMEVFVTPAGSNTFIALAVTAADGTFRVDNLLPGTYKLSVFDPADITGALSHYISTYYNGAGAAALPESPSLGFAGATTINVTSNTITTLNPIALAHTP